MSALMLIVTTGNASAAGYFGAVPYGAAVFFTAGALSLGWAVVLLFRRPSMMSRR